MARKIATRQFLFFSFVLLFSVSGVIGCRPSEVRNAQPPIESQLQAISVFYGQYTGQNRGQPPQNEKAFKDFIQKAGPERLQAMNVSSVDSLFVSPRDEQPLVINYNRPPAVPGAPDAGLLAYEQTGSGGKRYVLFASGVFEEVDEARFQELKSKQ